jgi:hypothetical protein
MPSQSCSSIFCCDLEVEFKTRRLSKDFWSFESGNGDDAKRACAFDYASSFREVWHIYGHFFLSIQWRCDHDVVSAGDFLWFSTGCSHRNQSIMTKPKRPVRLNASSSWIVPPVSSIQPHATGIIGVGSRDEEAFLPTTSVDEQSLSNMVAGAVDGIARCTYVIELTNHNTAYSTRTYLASIFRWWYR